MSQWRRSAGLWKGRCLACHLPHFKSTLRQLWLECPAGRNSGWGPAGFHCIPPHSQKSPGCWGCCCCRLGAVLHRLPHGSDLAPAFSFPTSSQVPCVCLRFSARSSLGKVHQTWRAVLPWLCTGQLWQGNGYQALGAVINKLAIAFITISSHKLLPCLFGFWGCLYCCLLGEQCYSSRCLGLKPSKYPQGIWKGMCCVTKGSVPHGRILSSDRSVGQ